MAGAHPEVWLRGAVPNIQPMLQPVAHSLMQSLEEIGAGLESADAQSLWQKPGRAASAGYHVLHAMGSLDRLFTYARGAQLDDAQRQALEREKDASFRMEPGTLRTAFEEAVARALEQLRQTEASDLLVARPVGRAGLPSTVLGLLFHGAEHTLRHAGQFVTTLKIVQSH
jgi:uncharacterized damage-inducible protein DinB